MHEEERSSLEPLEGGMPVYSGGWIRGRRDLCLPLTDEHIKTLKHRIGLRYPLSKEFHQQRSENLRAHIMVILVPTIEALVSPICTTSQHIPGRILKPSRVNVAGW